jgi:hypothetical protein
MGFLRVQLDVLHELFLRLRRKGAWAVHPGIGTPDRVGHCSPPSVGDLGATLPSGRASVNRPPSARRHRPRPAGLRRSAAFEARVRLRRSRTSNKQRQLRTSTRGEATVTTARPVPPPGHRVRNSLPPSGQRHRPDLADQPRCLHLGLQVEFRMSWRTRHYARYPALAVRHLDRGCDASWYGESQPRELGASTGFGLRPSAARS